MQYFGRTLRFGFILQIFYNQILQKMKSTLKFIAMLFCVSLSLTSCSKDSTDEPEKELTDPIIGEWKFVSENDYYCGSDEVAVERHGDEESKNTRFVFKADGTYGDYVNGVLTETEDYKGTWENLGDGVYKLNYYYQSAPSSVTWKIEFPEKDVMKFGVTTECDNDGTYNYRVYNK